MYSIQGFQKTCSLRESNLASCYFCLHCLLASPLACLPWSKLFRVLLLFPQGI